MSSAGKLSEIHGRKLARPLKPLHDILTAPATTNGSKIAVVCMHQPANLYSNVVKGKITADYLRWTFNEIIHVSHLMAIALAESGIRPGMTIAAFVENSIEAQILFRASLELNCQIALLNPKSTSNPRELVHLFEVLQPGAVMVPNLSIAKILEEVLPEAVKGASLKLVCAINERSGEWQNFGSFLEGGSGSAQSLDGLKIERKPEDVIVILFTSGTTSLPKGVPHSNSSLTSILLSNVQAAELVETSISVSHSPFYHMFGLVSSVYLNVRGCTMVYPAASFDAKSSLKAISLEGSNTFASVPAMNSALLNHQDFENKGTIDHIILGTIAVTPEFLRKVASDFGAKRTSDAYGLTETGGIWFHMPGTDPKATYPVPEMMLRVCDPETNEVLQRGVPGELHCGGTAVTSHYLLSKQQGEDPNKVFYDDALGHWMRTGDQGVMAENGEIRVIGRYKELIKRGGENLSPRLIEVVLAEDFGVVAEVIGVPDEIAGEVPVAIVKGNAGQKHDLSLVRGKLIEKLGHLFALEDIIPVESLGLEDFPRTHSGKTKKNVLKEKAIEFLQNSKPDDEVYGNITNQVEAETLTALWCKHLGVSRSNLHPQKNIHEFADSLTLTRFSGILRRTTGHSLSLQDLLDNPTIEQQVRILSSRKIGQDNIIYSQMVVKHAGPPTSDDMVHAIGDESILKKTKALSEEILKPRGLSWDDVEDVIPMHGALQRLLEKRRPQSNNHRHTWLCRGKTTKQLEEALKEALTRHSILRAMVIVFQNKAMHLTIRPSQKLFDLSFTHMSSVKNAEELWKQCYNNTELDWAADPGPLFRATITHVEEENCAGLVYMVQHSNYDAISFEMFLEDLDTLLVDPKALSTPRAPYKAWADSYYNLRHSEAAQRSVKWHVNRLQGVAKHRNALFPEQRAPEWFKGHSEGWVTSLKGPLGSPRKALDGGARDGAIGMAQRVRLHDTQALKVEHGIDVPQIVKAGLAIMITRRTKAGVALFGQYQASRSWAFLPDWQAKAFPDVMNVDGPTLQTTAVIADVESADTVGTLLTKLQEEQEGLNTHTHVPYDQLIERLNDGGNKSGEVMVEIMRRQIFNWLPGGLSTEYKCLQNVQTISRTDVGLLWNCKMLDEDTLQVHLSWDDAQLGGSEADEILEELLEITEKLSKLENWKRSIENLE
ncbi:hypothetical protein HYFRA_00000245 [Hymenoscyphus fraxineus]|uniref:Carrier domain-containing protein n=1 Tax=Hymenoscyphus fraxineus TaxID=746836 RepID=A0A9N9PL47_9HELO|nr:hypothetical protein HYFRA_00000245 [Hymenoscyphus fraxineus]